MTRTIGPVHLPTAGSRLRRKLAAMTTIAIDVPKERLREFRRKWKVTEFGSFWSVVRGDFGPDSDVELAERSAIEASRNYLRRAEILGSAVLLDVA
ncbi:MAG TPA: hypothetical protein VHL59_04800 [Thermoanaerobaculia bacterium]|nr:hypothetical protein [Thermoanaerobaculia bacterium]